MNLTKSAANLAILARAIRNMHARNRQMQLTANKSNRIGRRVRKELIAGRKKKAVG